VSRKGNRARPAAAYRPESESQSSTRITADILLESLLRIGGGVEDVDLG